jgi:hypothetical protein
MIGSQAGTVLSVVHLFRSLRTCNNNGTTRGEEGVSHEAMVSEPNKDYGNPKSRWDKAQISFSDLYGMARPCATELRQKEKRGVLENP